MGFPLF